MEDGTYHGMSVWVAQSGPQLNNGRFLTVESDLPVALPEDATLTPRR